MIAGVDGCPGGWIAAIEVSDGETTIERYSNFADLVQQYQYRIVVVDIPIGLLIDEPRLADKWGRRFLGSRGVCVFPAPYRSMLAATSYSDACELRRKVDGKSCSQQAYSIISKIREVDHCMNPGLQNRIFEGHPEISFALANGGEPLRYKKKSAAGKESRRSILEKHFADIGVRLAEKRPTGVGLDDLFDAYAMLWTARRIVSDDYQSFPPVEQLDPTGLRVRIVA